MALLLTHRIDEGTRLTNVDSGKTLDLIVKSIEGKKNKVRLVLKEPENTEYYQVEIINNCQLIELHMFPGLNIGIGHCNSSSNKISLIYDLDPSIRAIRSNYSPNNDFLGYAVRNLR